MSNETRKNKAILVDRDDTLCPDVPYCKDPSKIKVFADVPDAIKKLKDSGYLILMVTNQSGIGRGYFTEDDLKKVNGELLRQIEVGGGKIDDIFYCPHTPSDNCDCRKPKTGMGIAAISKYNLDPEQCWMIGDKEKDVEFGKALGMKTVQVSDSLSFSEAATIILDSDSE